MMKRVLACSRPSRALMRPRCLQLHRQEGLEPTAAAIRKHLQDLGLKDPSADPELDKQSRAELEEFRKSLSSWMVGLKMRMQSLPCTHMHGVPVHSAHPLLLQPQRTVSCVGAHSVLQIQLWPRLAAPQL